MEEFRKAAVSSGLNLKFAARISTSWRRARRRASARGGSSRVNNMR